MLEGALIRVCAYASLTKEELSVELAERVLADILSDSEPRPITPTLILAKTSEMFGFSIEEIQGKSRRRPLVTARQVGMYVFRDETDLSYPAIAREFGGRDHTTVIHAVEKIGALMKERRQIPPGHRADPDHSQRRMTMGRSCRAAPVDELWTRPPTRWMIPELSPGRGPCRHVRQLCSQWG